MLNFEGTERGLQNGATKHISCVAPYNFTCPALLKYNPLRKKTHVISKDAQMKHSVSSGSALKLHLSWLICVSCFQYTSQFIVTLPITLMPTPFAATDLRFMFVYVCLGEFALSAESSLLFRLFEGSLKHSRTPLHKSNCITICSKWSNPWRKCLWSVRQDCTCRQQKELHLLALMIQATVAQYAHQKKTTHSKSYLFFSDRGIGAAMPLVKHGVMRRRPQKSSAWFTCRFAAVSMRRSLFPALPARLPAALCSPFTGNDWFLSGRRFQCEMASKEARRCRTVNSLIDCNTKSTVLTLFMISGVYREQDVFVKVK